MLHLYSFDSGYSLVVVGKDFLSGCGRQDQILQKKNPQTCFPIFTTIKLIYTLVYQSLNSIFSLCFLLNESFSKCQQSYNRNIPVGYFEGIYTCENLTFHLQTEKDVKFVSEMHKFLENSHYYLQMHNKFSWYDVDQRN